MATTAWLLYCPEEEFDKAIKTMEFQGLVETILRLQKEMVAEQENFDLLTAKLSAIEDTTSPEYEAVSDDLQGSQQRLMSLMNRNMKCFSQQTASDNTELLSGLAERANALDRSQEQKGVDVELHTNPERTRDKDSSEYSGNRNLVSECVEPEVTVQSVQVSSTRASKPAAAAWIKGDALSKSKTSHINDSIRNEPRNTHINGTVPRGPPTSHTNGGVHNETQTNDRVSGRREQQPSQNGVTPNTDLNQENKSKTSVVISQTTVMLRTSPVNRIPEQNGNHSDSAGSPINGYHGNEDAVHVDGDDVEKWKPGFTQNAVAQFENLARAGNGNSTQDNHKVTLGTSPRNVIYDSRRPEVIPQAQKPQGTNKLNKLNELRSKVQSSQETGSKTKPASEKKVEVKTSSVTMMLSPEKTSSGRTSPGDKPPQQRSTSPVQLETTTYSSAQGLNPVTTVKPVYLGRTRSPGPEDDDASGPGQGGWYLYSVNKDSKAQEPVSMVTQPISETEQVKQRSVNEHIHPKGREPVNRAVHEHKTEQTMQKSVNEHIHPKGREPVVRAVPKPKTEQIVQKSVNEQIHPKGREPVNQAVPEPEQIVRRSVAERIQEYASLQQTESSGNHGNRGKHVTSTGKTTTAAVPTIAKVRFASRTEVRSGSGAGSDAENRDLSSVERGSETWTNSHPAPDTAVNHDHQVLPPAFTPSEGFTADEKVKDRVTLKDWDPCKVIQQLYAIQLLQEPEEPAKQYVDMEGYLEKLPINKKKATLLKTWKRRYFKATQGTLYYYEEDDEPDMPDTAGGDRPSGEVQLMGGTIDDLGDRMIGIDDGRCHYLTVRCPTDQEHSDWKVSLESQIVDNSRAAYVKPVLRAKPHYSKRVVVVDLGSCSVRAGVLGDKPSLPQVFFPCVVAINRDSGRKVFGGDAFKPNVRDCSHIVYPVQASVQVEKFSMDIQAVSDLFGKVFQDLKVDPRSHWVMLSAPGNLSDKIKEQLMDMLVKRYGVLGVNIVNQTLLALYSYGAKSGIMVDIGERLEIVPITDGYIVDGGMSRQPYGGHRVAEALNSSLTELKYRFFSDVEFQLVRLALEKSCFVSENYSEDINKPAGVFRKTLDLSSFDLPEGSWKHVTHDQSRFKSTEGLFNLEMWGMDNPPLQKSIQCAIHACPMDTRREMWRSIYLSGGVTMLPGFTERLQQELTKLAPPSIRVQVHSAPQRYHAAYVGACTLAALQEFESACIKAEDWRKDGPITLRKWHSY